MDQNKNLLFYLVKKSKRSPTSDISHIWKAYLTLGILKQDKCQKTMSSAYYCVQLFTVFTVTLIYTCSAFSYQHAAVVSCFTLSALYWLLFSFIFFFREKFRSDYKSLKSRLKTLPDKITHDVMVSATLFSFPIQLYSRPLL